MKNSIIIFLAVALSVMAFPACENGNKNNGSTENATAEAGYACPMHLTVTGKAGDTCHKCGMPLEALNAEADAAYACPMHPDVTGKAGDKCSKCGMPLEMTMPAEGEMDDSEEMHDHEAGDDHDH